MFFKTNYSSDGLVIKSENIDLKDRWRIFSCWQMAEATGSYLSDWREFEYVMTGRGAYLRTEVALAYDYFLGKPAIAKTICYRPEDKLNKGSIEKRREILKEQLELLNEISSPLLPEPLDWFEIDNRDEGLTNEPVLILDYQPGKTLTKTIKTERFIRENDKTLDESKIARILLEILAFLKILKEKNYACLNLSSDHVIILKNDKTRFIGLGGICKVVDGHLDENNVNFGMTCKGYAAPELNDPTDDWKNAKSATPEQVGAFSLGAILYCIVYNVTKFDINMLSNGSLVYPNPISESMELNCGKSYNAAKIKNLITDLCKHDPKERLTDLDEIEKRINTFSGDIETILKNKEKERKREKIRKQQYYDRNNRNNTNSRSNMKNGIVEWYRKYDTNSFGKIRCDGIEDLVHVSQKVLDNSGISELKKGMKIQCLVLNGDKGPYTNKVYITNEEER